MRDTPSTHELADALVETIIARYELTADRLGGLHLPPTYAGHPVDSTAHCVTAWTLSGLAEFGLTVGVEFHGWTLTHHAASAVRLVEAVGASDLFTYWQPVYWDAQVQHDDERQFAEFEQLIPHLSHLHTDWRVDGARRPLEEIEPLWRAVLTALPTAGRWTKPRFAFIEYVPGDDPAALAGEADMLRSWIADASGG